MRILIETGRKPEDRSRRDVIAEALAHSLLYDNIYLTRARLYEVAGNIERVLRP